MLVASTYFRKLFMLDLMADNILSPMVLAFVLGIVASFLRSDLKFPDAIYSFLSIYLLFAIGLKGGVTLSKAPLYTMSLALLVALVISALIPCVTFFCARFMRYSTSDSAALAAHYGSVSVVTFIAAQVFVENGGHPSDSYMAAILAVMEVPAIVMALVMARTRSASPCPQKKSLWEDIRSILTGKSILLLMGGLLIGYISGETGLARVSPFFVTPFQGVLVLFLLEMGLVAGHRLVESRRIPISLIFLGIFIPLLSGTFGIFCAKLIHMSVGNATLLATLAASSSYIAAPAAVRLALPKANPAYYLTSSLAVTFPFNLSIGVPLYYQMALSILG